MKLSHREKKRMARRHGGRLGFASKFWENRKAAKARKQANQGKKRKEEPMKNA